MATASGVTGKFSTLTGRTSDKLPEEFIERRIHETRVHEHFVIDTSAMVVDHEGYCWLNPNAYIQSNTSVVLSSTSPLVLVKHEDRGYVINLQSTKGHRWKPGPRPEAVDGRDWIRVVEVRS